MTEKRFNVITHSKGFYDREYYLHDNQGELVDSFGDDYSFKDDFKKVNNICDKLNEVADENEQLKQTINDIRLDWNRDYRDFNKDTLCIEDHNTKIKLKDGRLYIEVFIPKINEYFRFFYFVTGRTLNRKFVLGDNDDN